MAMNTELEILRDKVQTYETLLHKIHLYRRVTLDVDRLDRVLDTISTWSTAQHAQHGNNKQTIFDNYSW